jgi:two-component system, chemotaxis family, protein-glutamate methylesterase/glutaminase
MNKIVVITASEGGLDPLRRIVSELPRPSYASVLIVWHVGRNETVLPSILNRACKLEVEFAEHGEQITPGRVYVAPPDRHLLLWQNRIRLTDGPKVNHTRPAADPLFISAAHEYGGRVLGVVLSGGDGDGARGLRIIKAHGGTALVQRPIDAVNPEMPFAAMLADHPDDILSVEEIARRIRDFCSVQERSAHSRDPAPPAPSLLTDER